MADFELIIGARVDAALNGIRQVSARLDSLNRLANQVTKALAFNETIKVRLDITAAERSFAALRNQLNSTLQVRAEAQVSTRNASRAVAALERQFSSGFRVEVDTSEARKDIAALRRNLVIDSILQVDTSAARREVTAFERGIRIRNELDLDTSEAARRIERLGDRLRSEVSLATGEVRVAVQAPRSLAEAPLASSLSSPATAGLIGGSVAAYARSQPTPTQPIRRPSPAPEVPQAVPALGVRRATEFDQLTKILVKPFEDIKDDLLRFAGALDKARQAVSGPAASGLSPAAQKIIASGKASAIPVRAERVATPAIAQSEARQLQLDFSPGQKQLEFLLEGASKKTQPVPTTPKISGSSTINTPPQQPKVVGGEVSRSVAGGITKVKDVALAGIDAIEKRSGRLFSTVDAGLEGTQKVASSAAVSLSSLSNSIEKLTQRGRRPRGVSGSNPQQLELLEGPGVTSAVQVRRGAGKSPDDTLKALNKSADLADIEMRAREALEKGLSGAVAGSRAAIERQGLIERFQTKSLRAQSPEGVNRALTERYYKAIQAALPPEEAKALGPASQFSSSKALRDAVTNLLRQVDDSVIEALNSRLKELKLQLAQSRGKRPRFLPQQTAIKYPSGGDFDFSPQGFEAVRAGARRSILSENIAGGGSGGGGGGYRSSGGGFGGRRGGLPFRGALPDIGDLASTLVRDASQLPVLLGGGGLAAGIFGVTARAQSQERSLEVLIGNLKQVEDIMGRLRDLGAQTPFTSDELIDSTKRLKAFGIATNDLIGTVQRLADVSGATGADLSGIVTAYGQVAAKGRLQGEELLQFQERGVDIKSSLKEIYGLDDLQFQKALEQGRIGFDGVREAVIRTTQAGGKYAEGAIAQSDTLSGRLSTLIDNIQNLGRVIGTILTPAIESVLTSAIDAVSAINDLLSQDIRAQKFGTTAAEILIPQRAEIERRAKEAADLSFPGESTGGTFLGIPTPGPTQRWQNRFQEARKNIEDAFINAYGINNGFIDPTKKGPKPPPRNTNIQLLPGSSAGSERADLDKKIAQNQVRLDNQVAENRLRLDETRHNLEIARIRERYSLEDQLQRKRDELRVLKYPEGPSREQAGLVNDLISSDREMQLRRRDIELELRSAQESLKRLRQAPIPQEVYTIPGAAGGLGASSAAGMGVKGANALGTGNFPMTSPRGMRWGRMHHGVDYHAPVGTPISMTLPGVVTGTGTDPGGYGLWQEVKLENGVKAFFGHLSEVVLRQGMSFNAGQIVARTGNSGSSTGPHLHTGDKSVQESLSIPYTRLGGQAIQMPNRPAAGMAMTEERNLIIPSVLEAQKRQGDIQRAEAEVTGLQKRLEDLKGSYNEFQSVNFDIFLTKTADAFDKQSVSIEKSNDELNQRAYLLMEGFSSAEVDRIVKLTQVNNDLLDKIKVVTDAEKDGLITTERATKARDALANAANRQADGIDKALSATLRERAAGEFVLAKDQTIQLRGEGVALSKGRVEVTQEEQAKIRLQQLGIDLNSQDAERVLAQSRINDGIARENQLRRNQIELVQSVGQALSTGVADAIDGLISGSKTLNESLADILRNIGQILIQNAVSGLLSSALGGFKISGIPLFPQRAEGGPTYAGVEYLVGERGPEIFRPKTSGEIISNEELRNEARAKSSSMTSAMSRYSPANEEGSRAFSEGAEGSPGGAGAGGGEPMVSVTTGPILRFQDEDYVRRDDFTAGLREAASQGAKLGEQRTLRRMQHSAGTRRRLGI